jgi:hypothetical protein
MGLYGNETQVTSEKLRNDSSILGTHSLDSNTVGGAETSGRGFIGRMRRFFRGQ